MLKPHSEWMCLPAKLTKKILIQWGFLSEDCWKTVFFPTHLWWVFPWNMVIFHRSVAMYQRVLAIHGCNALQLARDRELWIHRCLAEKELQCAARGPAVAGSLLVRLGTVGTGQADPPLWSTVRWNSRKPLCSLEGDMLFLFGTRIVQDTLWQLNIASEHDYTNSGFPMKIAWWFSTAMLVITTEAMATSSGYGKLIDPGFAAEVRQQPLQEGPARKALSWSVRWKWINNRSIWARFGEIMTKYDR